MLYEMNKFEMLKNYKDIKVIFKNVEGNIKDLQMLIYVKEFDQPIYSTKKGAFEKVKKTFYKREKVKWIFGKTIEEEKFVIKFKEPAYKKFGKFTSKLKYSVNWNMNMLALQELEKLDASKLVATKNKSETLNKVS